MANHLADALSPYLLQHAGNPVDWHPWGAEAFEKALREDKPVFLSVGYAACHWCHVMERESFEDERIARMLNEHFISVKVDREERPDIDAVYMEAVQAISGSGGWPMSVFLTPDQKPFYAGTYFPPQRRGRMPGFDEILQAVSDAWKRRREEAIRQADNLVSLLQADTLARLPAAKDQAELAQLPAVAAAALKGSFDPRWGGFGGAPKFPRPVDLRVLFRLWHRSGEAELLEMATTTLDRMAAGGIRDHLGGGFHRYSTDASWLVPHFEKMLYDNALLATCYLEAWQITGRPGYQRVARETLDYVLREMTGEQGGFYSSEDADSEGEEGRFYVWTFGEIQEVLGRERGAEAFSRVYGVSERGNFEGRSILNLPRPAAAWAQEFGLDPDQLERELDESRARLLAARCRRVRPFRDDKVLTGWNGLAIEAFALAGAALGEARYLEAAARAADFLDKYLRDRQGRLLHCRRDARASHPAYLEDHAALACGLVSLYEASFDERWIDAAIAEADGILAEFCDPQRGGFYATSARHQRLIARKQDLLDSAVPSGGGLAATALLRLAKLCGRDDYREAAEGALEAAAPVMQRAPQASGQMFAALDMLLGKTPELVLLSKGDASRALPAASGIHRRYLGSRVLAYRGLPHDARRGSGLEGLFRGKSQGPRGARLYVCENATCRAPIDGPEAIAAAIGDLAAPRGVTPSPGDAGE
ncbi:MAG: thioredoxin domain-containing protein [Pirellulaceae bacterium]|mgnify:FL=1|nr:thioredoxin domain-containing protein [Thermoguttaceae bacterium]MDI9445475.1 thioredoxin domain-containing protein [Planctomycetota bacterium]NLZ00479.1 thioredoxin domain-containing protein [Pirellulaceae bacterium]